MLTAWLTILLFPVGAHAWPGIVVQVIDGDSIIVEPLEGGDRIKIRLYGIDCPERDQPYGSIATGLVVNRILGQKVAIVDFYQDKYSRMVAAVVKLEDGNSLQEVLLMAGLAWVDPRYCKNCRSWKTLQQEAKTAGLGLWADEKPVPPWKWRGNRVN